MLWSGGAEARDGPRRRFAKNRNHRALFVEHREERPARQDARKDFRRGVMRRVGADDEQPRRVEHDLQRVEIAHAGLPLVDEAIDRRRARERHHDRPIDTARRVRRPHEMQTQPRGDVRGVVFQAPKPLEHRAQRVRHRGDAGPHVADVDEAVTRIEHAVPPRMRTEVREVGCVAAIRDLGRFDVDRWVMRADEVERARGDRGQVCGAADDSRLDQTRQRVGERPLRRAPVWRQPPVRSRAPRIDVIDDVGDPEAMRGAAQQHGRVRRHRNEDRVNPFAPDEVAHRAPVVPQRAQPDVADSEAPREALGKSGGPDHVQRPGQERAHLVIHRRRIAGRIHGQDDRFPSECRQLAREEPRAKRRRQRAGREIRRDDQHALHRAATRT